MVPILVRCEFSSIFSIRPYIHVFSLDSVPPLFARILRPSSSLLSHLTARLVYLSPSLPAFTKDEANIGEFGVGRGDDRWLFKIIKSLRGWVLHANHKRQEELQSAVYLIANLSWVLYFDWSPHWKAEQILRSKTGIKLMMGENLKVAPIAVHLKI